MTYLKFVTFIFIMIVQSSCASVHADSNKDSKAPQATPNGISLEASQNEQFPVTEAEKKKLLAEYKKSLLNEQKAMAHQEKASLKELQAAQSAKSKSWRDQERKARRKFFEQHTSGPERRQYVQDYLARKKAFDQSQKDELSTSKQGWASKLEDLKKDQKSKEDQFKSLLDQNKRPKF